MDERQPTISALRELEVEFDRLRPRAGRSPSARTLVATSAAVLVGLVALTPPGQALGEHIGDLLGIGDVPREEGRYGSDPRIVGVGQSPTGHPWEAVVSGEPGAQETCVFLGFVEVAGTGMGSCGQGEDLSTVIYRAPDGVLRDGSVVLQGLAAAKVARIEVTYADESGTRKDAQVDMSPVSADLLSQLNLGDEPFEFYVTFLPPGAVSTPVSDQTAADLSDIEVRAFDADGQRVAVGHLDDPTYEVWLDHAPLGHLPDRQSGKG